MDVFSCLSKRNWWVLVPVLVFPVTFLAQTGKAALPLVESFNQFISDHSNQKAIEQNPNLLDPWIDQFKQSIDGEISNADLDLSLSYLMKLYTWKKDYDSAISICEKLINDPQFTPKTRFNALIQQKTIIQAQYPDKDLTETIGTLYDRMGDMLSELKQAGYRDVFFEGVYKSKEMQLGLYLESYAEKKRQSLIAQGKPELAESMYSEYMKKARTTYDNYIQSFEQSAVDEDINRFLENGSLGKSAALMQSAEISRTLYLQNRSEEDFKYYINRYEQLLNEFPRDSKRSHTAAIRLIEDQVPPVMEPDTYANYVSGIIDKASPAMGIIGTLTTVAGNLSQDKETEIVSLSLYTLIAEKTKEWFQSEYRNNYFYLNAVLQKGMILSRMGSCDQLKEALDIVGSVDHGYEPIANAYLKAKTIYEEQFKAMIGDLDELPESHDVSPRSAGGEAKSEPPEVEAIEAADGGRVECTAVKQSAEEMKGREENRAIHYAAILLLGSLFTMVGMLCFKAGHKLPS